MTNSYLCNLYRFNAGAQILKYIDSHAEKAFSHLS